MLCAELRIGCGPDLQGSARAATSETVSVAAAGLISYGTVINPVLRCSGHYTMRTEQTAMTYTRPDAAAAGAQ